VFSKFHEIAQDRTMTSIDASNQYKTFFFYKNQSNVAIDKTSITALLQQLVLARDLRSAIAFVEMLATTAPSSLKKKILMQRTWQFWYSQHTNVLTRPIPIGLIIC
jgi:hypothetical protein